MAKSGKFERSNTKRGRPTDEVIFFEALSKIAKNTGKQSVPKEEIKKETDWSEEKYNRIVQRLKQEKKITKKPGRGGPIEYIPPQETRKLKVFISYSHKDKQFKDNLISHLEPLKKMNLIETWTDLEIKPGDTWDKRILTNLEKADIILLLISIDFINSQYCYERELEIALDRHDKQEAKVIPIILRSCYWQISPFSKIQSLPRELKPVAMWDDQEYAFTQIAEALHTLIEEIAG